MSMPERRANKRIPAKFKVSYVHKEDYLISFSKNISVDGMFIYTENPSPVGDTPKIVFSIDGRHEVAVYAEVIWVNNDQSITDRGVGLRFIDIFPLFQKSLLNFVNRVAIILD